MKILIVNKFLHHVGGVETYVDWQAKNLGNLGAELRFFGMAPPAGTELIPSVAGRTILTPNRDFNSSKAVAARSALSSIYSRTVEKMLADTVKEFQPDLVHFHSTCRQLTPSVARVASRSGLPCVMTAHEYKLVCATQRLWDERQDSVCTACLSGTALARMKNVAARRCVRGSMAASLVAMPEIPISDYLWRRSEALIHAPSKFMGSLIAGTPYVRNQVQVLDLPWGEPHARSSDAGSGRRALFLGRLEKEKGVDVLLDAWKAVEQRFRDSELIVAGGGSEKKALESRARAIGLERVRFIGRYDRSELPALFDRVAVSVHPSQWFENSPFTVRESLLHGVPAIVSDVGGMPEMVDMNCGTVVAPGDASALANAIVHEFSRRTAGTSVFRAAVADRMMSDRGHLEAIDKMYFDLRS